MLLRINLRNRYVATHITSSVDDTVMQTASLLYERMTPVSSPISAFVRHMNSTLRDLSLSYINLF
jgi:hypothetical protein